MRLSLRLSVALGAAASGALSLAAAAQSTLPLKHAAQPTTAAITAGDLMTRLYIFADDSMQGRQIGTVGHFKSTAYIANELRKMGMKPGGEHGTYFQNYPYVRRTLDSSSTLAAGGKTFHAGRDFVATSTSPRAPTALRGLPIVFGGTQNDTINPITVDQVRGKILVVNAPPGGFGRGGRGGRGRGAPSPVMLQLRAASDSAAAIVLVEGDSLPAFAVNNSMNSKTARPFSPASDAAPTPLTITVTKSVAEAILGGSSDAATKGQAGKSLAATLHFHDQTLPARNVIGIVTGSDPKLRGEYVALGAHNDHIGMRAPIDPDSVRIFNRIVRPQGLDSRGQATPEQMAEFDAKIAEWRKTHPIRVDSINNGADDDGSGSVTLLELAESFQKAAVKPKRSLIFVWHTGEESGLLGSRYFTDHPTVPRDSIVAQLNMDMVGRGKSDDIVAVSPEGKQTLGGDNYLQLVGSRRISTELGDIIEEVNKTEKMPFAFDYQYDANGHPQRIYCRSDHANYARYNIPITFFTTGLHIDYHQVTDEPQYIDYDHMARVGQLVHDVAVHVANLDHRPTIDHPVSDPKAPCVQ